jgi:arylformamidase
MKIYDISKTIDDRMAVWPGDRPFIHSWNMRLERGDPYNLSYLTMSAHTGTHMDAPYHFDGSGPDVASVPLEHCMGVARVFDLGHATCIIPSELDRLQWRGVERALFRTRASDLAEGRFDPDFAYLSEEGAHYLANLGLRLVGTDAPSVDSFNSRTFPAHHALLSRRIAILEGIRLGQVPAGDYELVVLPLKLAGLDGSPVRAVLRSAS